MPAPLVLPAPSPPAPSTTQGSTFTTIQLLLEFLVSPLLDLQVLLGSIWVPKEENLRQGSLYCQWVLLLILMEKQGPP